jgi:hypothetical protein
MRFYWLTLGVLCVWRVTHLLYAEDGPADLLVHFRRWMGSGFWGKLLDCFYCLSLWIAVPFALWIGSEWRERLLLWLALSAGAILLERAWAGPPPATYHEDKEIDDVVLREGQKPVSSELPDSASHERGGSRA